MPGTQSKTLDPARRTLEALAAREDHLRRQIAARRAAIETAADAPDPAGDAGDVAFGRVAAEVEHDLMEITLRELAEIGAARSRIAEGTYGECLDCMEPIDPARLEANPLARRCTACQELAERRTRKEIA
jgi:RNA polymerase-binding transcription factor DksA